MNRFSVNFSSVVLLGSLVVGVHASESRLMAHIKRGVVQGDSLSGLSVVVTTEEPFHDGKGGKMPSMGKGDLFQGAVYSKELTNRGADVVYEVEGCMKEFFTETGFPVERQEGVEYQEVKLCDMYEELGVIPAFRSDKPVFHVSEQRMEPARQFFDEHVGGNMAVLCFSQCAKNHNPSRSWESRKASWLAPMKNVVFLDLDYNSSVKVSDVITPADHIDNFDRPAFLDTLALLFVIKERGGKVVAAESGCCHLAYLALGNAMAGSVYGVIPDDETVNERFKIGNCVTEDCEEGNTATKSPWSGALKLFRREKKSWDGVKDRIRDTLREDALAYREKRQGSQEETLHELLS